ncbi:hypothetical protein ACQKIC_16150 [Peribacillus sp. NPDC046944]|uniref:hypothetical protein n=1 Tax=unclassified Peribacillus TaxID=2675266 RepID=UPI003D027566
MSTLSGPRLKTIKRLFALSRNKCAFPSCNRNLVTEDGKVVGKICHIKARSKGGPRYDSSQSDEERHGFDNLIIMCPIHHDVIDSDEKSYTVERLEEIKKQQKSREEGYNGNLDEVANSLLLNMKIENNVKYMYELNNNGQLANVIVNNNYINIPNKSVRVSARILLINITRIMNELKARNEYVGIEMSQIQSLPNFKDYYESISDYLSMEDSTNLLEFFNSVALNNEHIIAINDYYEKKGFTYGMLIMHAGLRSLQKTYESLIISVLDIDLNSLIQQLNILAEISE